MVPPDAQLFNLAHGLVVPTDGAERDADHVLPVPELCGKTAGLFMLRSETRSMPEGEEQLRVIAA